MKQIRLLPVSRHSAKKAGCTDKKTAAHGCGFFQTLWPDQNVPCKDTDNTRESPKNG
jgi:hypothetical protein